MLGVGSIPGCNRRNWEKKEGLLAEQRPLNTRAAFSLLTLVIVVLIAETNVESEGWAVGKD